MGRINKRFRATRGAQKIRGTARIDSGADVTILSLREARELGLDVCTEKIASMRTKSGRLLGFTFPLKLRIGKRAAKIHAFVPTFVEEGQGAKKRHRKVRRGVDLIGHDFLQKTKATLDYSKPHGRVFSTLPDYPPTLVRDAVTSRDVRIVRGLCRIKPSR